MMPLILAVVTGLLFPWAPLERQEAPKELFVALDEGRWEDAEEGLRDLLERDASARWMYLMGRLEESRARWWEAWYWYGWAVAWDDDPWSTMASSRWVRLEFRLPVREPAVGTVWAVLPIEPLGGTPRESAVARALTHYLVRHLSTSTEIRPLGPRQLVRLKPGPSRYRSALPPAHTPAGMAARLSILPAPETNSPYLDPEKSDDDAALESALVRFQLQAQLTPTGRPSGPTAVALERALSSWLAKETVRWTPEEASRAAMEAGAHRILQGSLQELPEGGFRWTLALVEGDGGGVVAGPYEGWLEEGRIALEWDAALGTLGAGGATRERLDEEVTSPWGSEVPEEAIAWEAWGLALAAEDGQDPVGSARAYSPPATQYGSESWALEILSRAKGWNLPLTQVGAREEELLRTLARGRRDLEDAVRRSRSRMLSGAIPGDGPFSPDVLSAPQILGDDGRLILEGRVPR
jgi:hypothetical protein